MENEKFFLQLLTLENQLLLGWLEKESLSWKMWFVPKTKKLKGSLGRQLNYGRLRKISRQAGCSDESH